MGYTAEGLQLVMFSWNATVFQTREKSQHPLFADQHWWLICATSRTPPCVYTNALYRKLCVDSNTYVLFLAFSSSAFQKHKILTVKPGNLKNVHQPVIPKARDFYSNHKIPEHNWSIATLFYPLCNTNEGEPQQCGVPTITKKPYFTYFSFWFHTTNKSFYTLCQPNTAQVRNQYKRREMYCVFYEHMLSWKLL